MAAGPHAGNSNASPPSAKGGFNKLFVMVPVMLAARKLDAEDPNTVHWLRVAYGSMQTICLLVVLYTFLKASSLKEGGASNIVYVPAAPTVRIVHIMNGWSMARTIKSNICDKAIISHPVHSSRVFCYRFPIFFSSNIHNSLLRRPMQRKSIRRLNIERILYQRHARYLGRRCSESPCRSAYTSIRVWRWD